MPDTKGLRSPDKRGDYIGNEIKERGYFPEFYFYKAIENAGGVPFYLVFGNELEEGRYLTIGKGITELLGIPAEEFTEKLFQSLIEKIVPLTDNIPADLSQSREKFVKGKLENYKAEILIRTLGNEKKWILDSSVPIKDAETDKVIGAFGILFNIDESKQILEKMEAARLQTEESNRLNTAFLRNISHEIRTPLNAIVGFATLLGEPEYDQVQRQEFANIISNKTDHLLEILNDIIEMSDIESNTVKVKKDETNLNMLVRRVYKRFKTKVNAKNIQFEYSVPSEDNEVNITTDRFKLFQILQNLVGNAIKFTSEGKVHFGYKVKNGELEFYVSDTGIGISPEHQSKIFNRLFQADNSYSRRYEGTGLGLAVCKAYVELLGGEIRFYSTPGVGSTFYFTLPFENPADAV